VSDSLKHIHGVYTRFNRAASSYESLALPQRRAAEHLLSLVDPPEEPWRVLEAGCGSGQLTRMLAMRFPRARIDAFDLSEAMIEIAGTRTGPSDRVRWFQSDFTIFTAPLPYHLVISASSLHWAPDLGQAVANLARMLAPRGILAAAVMLDGTLAELAESRRAIAPDAEPAGRMPRLDHLTRALTDAGLESIRSGNYPIPVSYPSAEALFGDLHAMGLNGGLRFRPRRLLRRGELRAVAGHYNRNFRNADGTVRATYQVGWALAQRG
jgi:malonyl-CoA O-methyltransferase